MTFRLYMAFMATATLLSAFAWGMVVLNTDPYETGVAGFVMFYVTLFMSLVGALTILGTLYRVSFRKRNEVLSREVKISFRHAIALALAGVAALALSARGSLRWWTFLLLIAVLTVIEYVFLVKEDSRRV